MGKYLADRHAKMTAWNKSVVLAQLRDMAYPLVWLASQLAAQKRAQFV